MKIGFIGTGHMGGSILRALSKNPDYLFYVNDLDVNKTNYYKNLLEDRVIVTNTIELIKNADYIFLGVKPKDMKELLQQIKNETNNKIFISMAAGFNISEIIEIIGNIKIIRIMPNTPVLVSSGITFYTPFNIEKEELNQFIEMMSYTGSLYEITEDKMDSVSVLTGSTPAFLDFFLDALTEFGVKQGFTKEEATLYVLKMAEGVILLNLNSNKSLKELGNDVCSPGGSTIEGVKSLLENNLYEIILKAAEASYHKNKNMK